MIHEISPAQDTENNATRGRADMQMWRDRQPDNFFTADKNLQAVLKHYLGADYDQIVANLLRFGGECATVIDDAAMIEDRIGNHPRLDRYSGVGERTEGIEFHPNHDVIGALVWRSGMLSLQAEAGNTVHQMALFYLLGHNGEGGHMCSVACTSGLIRALQMVGDDTLKAKYLPALIDPDYGTMQHGAQFLTEVQGGSDVGANAVIATQDAGGVWRIDGEKWFCSNINADQFLVMARPAGAVEGTKGLGVFLVPRRLDDGATNGFYIRRLKDKLGTRTLASAELDFVGAVAYPIGRVDEGFKNTVELVLNTSRLMNAVSCAGVMMRAWWVASGYARERKAFGQAIIEYPLVQEALVDILSEATAATASGFALAHLLDRIETGRGTDDDRAVYRLVVNLNKYITSIRGSEVVHRAIEVLGGNGAIESFSILPRLYRDMVVLESWEGTHNVLCLQVLRDIARYDLHLPYERYIMGLLEGVTAPHLQALKDRTADALHRAMWLIQRLAEENPTHQQGHARRLADALSHVAQAALLLAESEAEFARDPHSIKPLITAYFINRHMNPAYDPLDDEGYFARLQAIIDGM